jgi:hypothetical protein
MQTIFAARKKKSQFLVVFSQFSAISYQLQKWVGFSHVAVYKQGSQDGLSFVEVEVFTVNKII